MTMSWCIPHCTPSVLAEGARCAMMPSHVPHHVWQELIKSASPSQALAYCAGSQKPMWPGVGESPCYWAGVVNQPCKPCLLSSGCPFPVPKIMAAGQIPISCAGLWRLQSHSAAAPLQAWLGSTRHLPGGVPQKDRGAGRSQVSAASHHAQWEAHLLGHHPGRAGLPGSALLRHPGDAAKKGLWQGPAAG